MDHKPLASEDDDGDFFFGGGGWLYKFILYIRPLNSVEGILHTIGNIHDCLAFYTCICTILIFNK